MIDDAMAGRETIQQALIRLDDNYPHEISLSAHSIDKSMNVVNSYSKLAHLEK